jgi:UDP-N-acetylglucosamine 4,6-dehydratase
MLDDKTILITGGTGSFGRAFVTHAITNYEPRKLIILSRDELKQHEMRTRGYDHPCLRYFIGNVRDLPRLRRAFAGVDIIIHAAALKQVPACEYSPFEATKTNILGAQNVIEAALDCGVGQVLALSSDKCVQPANLYGATKLVMEKLFVHANAYAPDGGTRFSCVRYGNVVGSRGSVIPLFMRQLLAPEPLTITDERMTRFWITLDQAVRFVVRCLSDMRGGEVFVPRIPSMRIVDLARAIAPDREQVVVGIRPGEKLHEVLVSADESRHTYRDGGRYIILPESPDARGDALRWWERREALPDGFSFTSDTNDQWLEGEDLRAMVHKVEVKL